METIINAPDKQTEQIDNEIIRYSNSKKSVLKYFKPASMYGQSIGKIAKNFFYVNNDVKVEELVEELLINKEVPAVGVVDSQSNVLGVISRNEIFDTYSKPFGRDIYKNKNLDEFIIKTRSFNFKKSLFSVSHELNDHLNSDKTFYFLLVNDENSFAGLFSTTDLLVHLSEMTQKDIALATKLQSCIVKEEDSIIKENRFELLGATRMAKGVGGDFYSFDNYTDNQWIISLCDVSGKGIPASLLSVFMSGMISIYDFKKGIKDYLLNLNNYTIKYFDREKFITGIFIDFNQETGKIKFYDVGHSYIYIFRNNKFYTVNSQKSIPLGIAHDFETVENSFTLKKDDILILMTDGIAEQKNSEGEDYGEEPVFKVLKKNAHLDLITIKNKLFEDLLAFRKNQTQTDDITITMLKYLK